MKQIVSCSLELITANGYNEGKDIAALQKISNKLAQLSNKQAYPLVRR